MYRGASGMLLTMARAYRYFFIVEIEHMDVQNLNEKKVNIIKPLVVSHGVLEYKCSIIFSNFDVSINPLFPMQNFFFSLKTSQSRKVFLGVEKRSIGNKWSKCGE